MTLPGLAQLEGVHMISRGFSHIICCPPLCSDFIGAMQIQHMLSRLFFPLETLYFCKEWVYRRGVVPVGTGTWREGEVHSLPTHAENCPPGSRNLLLKWQFSHITTLGANNYVKTIFYLENYTKGGRVNSLLPVCPCLNWGHPPMCLFI